MKILLSTLYNIHMKRIHFLCFISVLMFLCGTSCNGNDDDDVLNLDKGKGSVKITSIDAQRKTSTGLQINITIKASGVSADEVKMLGVTGGTSSDADGSLWASVGGGKTSGSTKIVTGLRSKTTYYVKAFVKTKEGTVYSSVKKVTTP